jgi:hypothetical protein
VYNFSAYERNVIKTFCRGWLPGRHGCVRGVPRGRDVEQAEGVPRWLNPRARGEGDGADPGLSQAARHPGQGRALQNQLRILRLEAHLHHNAGGGVRHGAEGVSRGDAGLPGLRCARRPLLAAERLAQPRLLPQPGVQEPQSQPRAGHAHRQRLPGMHSQPHQWVCPRTLGRYMLHTR